MAENADLVRAVWALVAGIVVLVLREVWQGVQARRQRRSRDRGVMSALLREVSAIVGLAGAISRDLAKEREMLEAHERWRIKPFPLLPVDVYELVKSDPPRALLERPGAISDLLLLQAQCAYTNALCAQQFKWKTPGAQQAYGQMATIADFHGAIAESLARVVAFGERLAVTLREAGVAVGGLNLKGAPDRSRKRRSG